MMRCLIRLRAIIAILALSLAAEAQPRATMPRIGYLTLRAGPTAEDEAFTQGLHELGWSEGQTIAIEYRWAAGQVDRLSALAEELVHLKVDCIIVTAGHASGPARVVERLVHLKVDCIIVTGTPVAQSAKAATQSIPIVMT